MEFWKRIKYELKSHGLSQKELAEKLNLNIQTLRKFNFLKPSAGFRDWL